jgi:hypothetical protein
MSQESPLTHVVKTSILKGGMIVNIDLVYDSNPFMYRHQRWKMVLKQGCAFDKI